MGETRLIAVWADGREYEAKTARDLIRVMKLDGYYEGRLPSLIDYKEQISQRVTRFRGHRIEYHDAISFLRELEKIGCIKLICKPV